MMSTLMRWSGWFIPSGNTGDGRDAVAPALTRCAVAERVEIACAGGHGRTGAALACVAILDGTRDP